MADQLTTDEALEALHRSGHLLSVKPPARGNPAWTISLRLRDGGTTHAGGISLRGACHAALNYLEIQAQGTQSQGAPHPRGTTDAALSGWGSESAAAEFRQLVEHYELDYQVVCDVIAQVAGARPEKLPRERRLNGVKWTAGDVGGDVRGVDLYNRLEDVRKPLKEAYSKMRAARRKELAARLRLQYRPPSTQHTDAMQQIVKLHNAEKEGSGG